MAGMTKGRTPLQEASAEGRLADVVTLLSRHTDVAAADDAGSTALHFACQQGNNSHSSHRGAGDGSGGLVDSQGLQFICRST
jgi:Ankyrin repeats (3 copies)